MDIEEAHKLRLLSYEETRDLLLAFFDAQTQKSILDRIKAENIADVNEVLNVVLKGINSPRAISINDVNNDGEINIADIDAIIKKILE